MQSDMLGPLLFHSDAEYPDYSVTHLKAADGDQRLLISLS